MQQDKLGRGPFIELLNNIITQKTTAHEGFSFAIDGKWGCGKSWILKELEQKLESRNYFVIHYNCWENEYYEEPLVALLSVIADKLNLIDPAIKQKRLKQKIKILARFLANSTSIVAKGTLGIDFSELNKAGMKAIKADSKKIWNKNFDPNQLIKRTLETIRDYLLQLKNILLKSGFIGIVIVVDELDRCLPEYAIKVMQRLHFVCFNNDSDNYDFIQLAAINKSELLGSIIKTFGREFDLTQKYTDTEGHVPGRIYFDNFEEPQIQFGNYYFKKFFQMIIPVSNGNQIENPLSLLGDFEKNFDSNDTNGKKYVERFFTEVLSYFPMRTKLELIHLVKTTHEITALNSSLDKGLRYNTLCIELVDCLCKSILRKKYPRVLHRELDDGRHGLYLRIDNLTKIEGITNISEFDDAFEKWSVSECGYIRAKDNDFSKARIPFNLQQPESYLKAFYKYDESIRINGGGPIQSEVEFIKAFRATLDTLV